MSDLSKPTETSPIGIRFGVGLAFVVIGYAMALVGAIGMLKMSFVLSLCMLLSGGFLAEAVPKFFDRRLVLTEYSRSYRVALPVGMFVVGLGTYHLAGFVDIYHWYVHPAGAQLAFMVMVGAVFHGRHIAKQFARPKTSEAIEFDDSHETDETNPYAPPRY